MSEFLMIVPESWTELPWDDELYYAEDVLRAIASGDWASLSQYLAAADTLPVGRQAINANLFQAGGLYRFWVLYANT